MNRARIVVIGAGLQGATVALALASKGYQSIILEEDSGPMRKASLRNEGKIHLGFVYALDRNYNTSDLMLGGALSFSSLIDSWCGAAPWNDWKSAGFCYAVMPDSLVSPESLEEFYGALSARVSDIVSRTGSAATYMGSDLSWLWRKSVGQMGRPWVDGRFIDHVFETEEVSVDPRRLSSFVSEKLLKSRKISLIFNTRVLEAKRTGDSFELVINSQGEIGKISADVVVNCAWADRVRLDEGLGLAGTREDYSYRVKYQILVQPLRGNELRPVTMVQGPYGDIVPWNDGSVYISWYPTGRTYFSSSPPDMSAEDPVQAGRVARDSLDVLAEMFPGLAHARVLSSLPGVIMARGETDVDNRASRLHERYNIGPRSWGNWWTIDTGKLTTAPLFAEQCSREIIERIGD